MPKHGVVFADGGIRGGNPGGLTGCAAILYVDGEMPRQSSRLLGEGSNNTAEFHGLLLALRLAAEAGVTHLRVRLDSKLIVEQVLGTWRVREPTLLPLRDSARRIAAKWFEEVQIDHVPREQNVEADAICRRLLDDAVGKIPRRRSSPGDHRGA